MKAPRARKFLEDRGLTPETIEAAGLGVSQGPNYSGWLAIPYHDGQGRRRMTRYRSLPPTDKQYRTLKGEGTHLYNVAAVENPIVAICEGEFDALILSQIGVPAVAIAGAKSWNRAWRWLFRNTDMVLVITDQDEEGLRARHKIVANLHDVTTAEPVDLPEGSDITDLYLSNPEELRKLVLT